MVQRHHQQPHYPLPGLYSLYNICLYSVTFILVSPIITAESSIGFETCQFPRYFEWVISDANRFQRE